MTAAAISPGESPFEPVDLLDIEVGSDPSLGFEPEPEVLVAVELGSEFDPEPEVAVDAPPLPVVIGTTPAVPLLPSTVEALPGTAETEAPDAEAPDCEA